MRNFVWLLTVGLFLATPPTLAKQPSAEGGTKLSDLACNDGEVIKFNATTQTWNCAPDKSGLTIVDANGVFVGIPTDDVSAAAAQAIVTVPSRPSQPFKTENVTPIGFGDRRFLLFTGPGCTGTAIIEGRQPQVSVWEGSLLRSVVVICPGGRLDTGITLQVVCDGAAELWFPADPSPEAFDIFEINSQMTGRDGSCTSFDPPQSRSGTLAEFITDLNSEFQTPLELKIPGQ